MMFSQQKVKIYALKKDKFISVSFDKPKKNEVKKSDIKPVTKTKEILKTKEAEINNLFSNVWTKNIKEKKVIKKKKQNKRLQEVLKKSKKLKIQKVKTEKKVIDKVVSTGTEVNEYRAKIQSIVYNAFTPPQNSQGHTVVAVIYLSAMGKLEDFRILRYSESKLLNEECDKLKERLMYKLFPNNPENKSGNYKIILTSKE